MADTPLAKRKTVAELEKAIAELNALTAKLRVERDDERLATSQAIEREKATRARFDDLKERLVTAESENQRMRGYIARVQEDDVVREELVAVGDPAGEQQLVPKRKPTPFCAPGSYSDLARRGGDGAMTFVRERDRPKPKHWVTY